MREYSISLSLFLLVFFCIIGSIKVFRWHPGLVRLQIGMLENYGLGPQIYKIIGILEIFGGIGSILAISHELGTVPAAGLAILSACAIGYHLRFDSALLAVPAISTALISFSLIVINLTHPPMFASPADIVTALTEIPHMLVSGANNGFFALAGVVAAGALFGLMLTKT